MTKVLLYSGGMDSWLIDKLWHPDKKIYVNIGGAYNSAEVDRLPDDVEIVDFTFLSQFELENRFVPMRNLYFLMIASHYGDEVCLGATAGDWGNNDKNPKFLSMAEDMLKYLWADKKANRQVKVCTDWINVSKQELIDRYLAQGGSIEELKSATFSCYTPENNRECMACYPCFRKFALLYANGANYTYDERKKMWEYVKSQIIPTKEQGGYRGTYYTDRGSESRTLIKAVNKLKGEFDV